MEKRIHYYLRFLAILVLVILPVILWLVSDVPRRSWLKEGLSLLTMLSFSVLLLQFFMSKINVWMMASHKFSRVLKWHKALGYIFSGILVFHPFFIVLPRFFESGVEPMDAFAQLLSSYSNPSVLMGMIAWALMWILALSAIFRNKLPMSYKLWKICHGILSLLFMGFAIYHIATIGRHSTSPMIIYLLTIAGVAVLMLINSYLFTTKKS